MKKVYLFILLLIFSLVLTSCTIVDGDSTNKVSVIMPTGTPSLALAQGANKLKESGNTVEITAGSDLLVAAFNQGNYDIIVAPVNLGAKMYNTNGNYLLFKTIVWGNLYLASKQSITSLQDIKDKEVVVFGKNSTPDIVFRALLNNLPDLNVSIKYVNDVSEANTLLAANKADYVISAEPALSKLKDKLGLSTVSLQDEWNNLTGNKSYPQAGIFVKKALVEDGSVRNALTLLKTSVNGTIINPTLAAENAVKLHKSFETLGVDTLVKAIPNCNYYMLDNEIVSVSYYLQTMIDLGFAAQVGGKLPDASFYLD